MQRSLRSSPTRKKEPEINLDYAAGSHTVDTHPRIDRCVGVPRQRSPRREYKVLWLAIREFRTSDIWPLTNDGNLGLRPLGAEIASKVKMIVGVGGGCRGNKLEG